MADRTNITWTDTTWNPVTGCSKASPGCAHCYAETMALRLRSMGRPEYQQVHDGTGWTGQAVCLPGRLTQPLHWRKPREVFVCSMSDLFHPTVPFEFIAAVFGVMAATPRHRYQVLTKRPEVMEAFLGWVEALDFEPWESIHRDGVEIRYRDIVIEGATSVPRPYHPSGMHCDEGAWPLPNVYLGTTAEDQQRADKRIPRLLNCPAAGRFVSLEPLLGPVRLPWEALMGDEAIHGIIVGGESGPGARPMHPGWVRSLRDQCGEAGVPFHFKQWGEWLPPLQQAPPAKKGCLTWSHDDDGPRRVGKHAAGRMLDGRTHDELPWRGVDRG